MNPTEHTAKTPSPKTGLFATLRGLLRVAGSSAPSQRPARLPLAVLGIVLATVALTASTALASTSYTAAGEITGPAFGETFKKLLSESVAVNDKNGHIYVADSGTGFVYDFASASDITPVVWNGSLTPAGSFGAGEHPVAAAVDNASGDVYVSDSTHKVIDKFDQNGTLVTSFGDTEAAGSPAPNGQLAGLKTPAGSFAPAETGSFGIAVDQATHDLYAIDAGNRAIGVFDETGAFLGAPSKAITEGLLAAEAQGLLGCGGAYADGIAVNDQSKELLLSDSCEVKAFRFALATGSFVAAITGSETPAGNFGAYTSLAADNSSGRIYVNDTANQVVDAYRPNATYTNSQITLTPSSFFGGVAVDQASHDVYVADNGRGAVELFAVHTGSAGPSIDSSSATGVTATSSTLEAELNPEGLPTAYHFEYDTAPYAEGELPHGTATSTASAGSGTTDVTESAPLQGLTPGRTYHYRVVATNSLGTVEGADGSFVTQGPSGPPLPDGRGWEMVSPPEKSGVQLDGLAEQGGDIQAAADGSGLAYIARGPINGEAPGSRSPAFSELLSRRGAGSSSWSTRDVTAPNEVPAGVLVGHGSEYQLFSADLSLAAMESRSETSPLSPPQSEAERGHQEHTPYVRQPDGSFTPLVTAANVPPGTKFGGKLSPGTLEGAVEFVAGTPDLSRLVLTSPQDLTEPVFNGGGNSSLYEWSAGALTLLSQVPSGSATVCGGSGPACVPAAVSASVSEAGHEGTFTRHALSSDGSRAIFEVARGGGANRPLYLRDVGRGETVQLDALQGGEGGEYAPVFQDASADGSRIFFTDEARLTPGSTSTVEQPDLYMCQIGEVGGALSCTLRNLTVDHNPGEHAAVQATASSGVIPGASEDGSQVYFVANGALAAGAVHGNCRGSEPLPSKACNLYRYDVGSGETHLVAVLSGSDHPDWALLSAGRGLAALTSRVSPDGRWLAFMSQRPLTGYDNRDARTGVRDEEVFLYDAGSGSHPPVLRCVSCNPTGARPHGLPETIAPGPLVDRRRNWVDGPPLAASIPGWTPLTLGRAIYQSRYLSDSGRLFFNAADALVPGDSNGTEDVYQYELPQGDGQPASNNCTPASRTFVPTAGGCVDLISSGASGEESAFLDASENGNDVFFLTAAQLSVSDRDTALDVYDAHVCTAGLPCPPPPPPPAPECDGDACQQPAVPPNDSTPGSLTFHGGGNLVPSAPVRKAIKCKRGKKLRHGKCVKAKGKHKHGRKAKRTTNNRRAGR